MSNCRGDLFQSVHVHCELLAYTSTTQDAAHDIAFLFDREHGEGCTFDFGATLQCIAPYFATGVSPASARLAEQAENLPNTMRFLLLQSALLSQVTSASSRSRSSKRIATHCLGVSARMSAMMANMASAAATNALSASVHNR